MKLKHLLISWMRPERRFLSFLTSLIWCHSECHERVFVGFDRYFRTDYTVIGLLRNATICCNYFNYYRPTFRMAHLNKIIFPQAVTTGIHLTDDGVLGASPDGLVGTEECLEIKCSWLLKVHLDPHRRTPKEDAGKRHWLVSECRGPSVPSGIFFTDSNEP